MEGGGVGRGVPGHDAGVGASKLFGAAEHGREGEVRGGRRGFRGGSVGALARAVEGEVEEEKRGEEEKEWVEGAQGWHGSVELK